MVIPRELCYLVTVVMGIVDSRNIVAMKIRFLVQERFLGIADEDRDDVWGRMDMGTNPYGDGWDGRLSPCKTEDWSGDNGCLSTDVRATVSVCIVAHTSEITTVKCTETAHTHEPSKF